MKPIEQFQLYKSKVDELENCKLIKAGFSASVQLDFDRARGIQWSLREPEEDDLRSYLLTFRQFTLDHEPVFLSKIFNLCEKYISDDFLKENLRAARQDWKRIQKDLGMTLVLGGQEFTPEHVMDLWVNGFYFHSDEEKRKTLIALLPHVKSLVRGLFLIYLVDASRIVFYTACVIGWAERDSKLLAEAYKE